MDVFAVGAIMAELYTMRPLFPGSSEADQLLKICQVLGTPTREVWPEGFKLAEQIGFKFPQCPPANLRSLVQTASDSALDLMSRTKPQIYKTNRNDALRSQQASHCC